MSPGSSRNSRNSDFHFLFSAFNFASCKLKFWHEDVLSNTFEKYRLDGLLFSKVRANNWKYYSCPLMRTEILENKNKKTEKCPRSHIFQTYMTIFSGPTSNNKESQNLGVKVEKSLSGIFQVKSSNPAAFFSHHIFCGCRFYINSSGYICIYSTVCIPAVAFLPAVEHYFMFYSSEARF